MDERYATFREHAELRERTATLEETVRQVGPSLNRIETMIVAQKAVPQPQQETAAALALHRALDAFDKRDKGGGIGHSILITLALIGVGVTAFLIGKVFF
jgi:hypothetical protein